MAKYGNEKNLDDVLYLTLSHQWNKMLSWFLFWKLLYLYYFMFPSKQAYAAICG